MRPSSSPDEGRSTVFRQGFEAPRLACRPLVGVRLVTWGRPHLAATPLTELNRALGGFRPRLPASRGAAGSARLRLLAVGAVILGLLLVVALRRDPDGGEPMAIAAIEKRAAPIAALPPLDAAAVAPRGPASAAQPARTARASPSSAPAIERGIIITVPEEGGPIKLAPRRTTGTQGERARPAAEDRPGRRNAGQDLCPPPWPRPTASRVGYVAAGRRSRYQPAETARPGAIARPAGRGLARLRPLAGLERTVQRAPAARRKSPQRRQAPSLPTTPARRPPAPAGRRRDKKKNARWPRIDARRFARL